jgi:hypothetical protein
MNLLKNTSGSGSSNLVVPALEDVTEIGLFFERDSPQFAEMIVRSLYYSIDRLRKFHAPAE